MAAKKKRKVISASSSKVVVYTSYRFMDKDPIIDKVRTVWRDAGSPSYKKCHELSGVSATTPRNWFDGGTMRPTFASLNAFCRALGHELSIVKMGSGRSKRHLQVVR